MAMNPIKFGAPALDGASVLIHGINNVGKTTLLAAALKHYSKQGKVTMASFKEEQGQSSASGMGLEKEDLGYQCLYEVASIDDYVEWLAMVEKGGYIATGSDSLWALYRAIQRKKTGGARPPSAGKTDNNEWPWIHNEAHNVMTRWRYAAKWNLMVCPSDNSQNVVKEVESAGFSKDTQVCPDLNGKMANACVCWFNLVGYLICDIMKQGNVVKAKRTLSFVSSKNYLTRQRMPLGGNISELIEVPENDPGKGWEKMLELANAAYAKAYAKKEGGA